MTQRIFTADLLGKQPPYNPMELGSSCVFADARETSQRAPGNNHGTDATLQQGYNQAYYMENVIPSSRGFTSVGYQSVVPALADIVPQYVLECRSPDGGLSYVAVAGTQVMHWFDDQGWAVYSNITADPEFVPQVAVVRGQSYFYFGLYKIYTLDPEDLALEPITLQGIDPGAISGICSGGAQLVLYTSNTIYYSAVLDSTDFLPSLATGAGSTQVLALKGTIVTCLPLGQDFVIYTQYSAVHARYTGNFALPYVFNEVSGSTGIITQKHVAYNTNTGSHVAYGNAGFQEITASGVASVFPEIADQIAKGIIAEVDPITDLVTYNINTALNIKVGFVANRWLFISIGDTPEQEVFKEAYMYDTTLQRWGRLKLTHTCIFEWAGSASVEGIKTYQDLANAYPLYGDTDGLLYRDLGSLAAKYSALNKQKIAVMSHLGNVCILVAAESGQLTGNNIGTDAVMPRILMGRFKLFRDQGTELQWVRLNKLVQGNIVLIGHDYNGAAVKRMENLSPSDFHAGTYSKKLNADSVSVEMRGTFVLTDLVLCAASGGLHKQYAPAVKKFERLLYSQIYSIEGDTDFYTYDEATVHFGRITGILDVTDAEYVNTLSVASASLRPVLNSYALDEQSFQNTCVIQSAVLLPVLITHTVKDIDRFTSTFTIQSGLLDQVLVPHVQPMETGQQYITTLTIQSGSLV